MFPEACEEVVGTLTQVFALEAKTQMDQISTKAPLVYHQTYSALQMTALKISSLIASLHLESK
jgi:hypothetical protein